MKPFEYLQPESIEETSQLLGNDWDESLLIAGGTDLLGLIKHGIQQPEKLVDFKSLSGMDSISYTAGKGLKIGALVHLSTLMEHSVVNEKYPVLAQSILQAATPQLRNMGTIGGNICQRPRCWYFRGEFHCLRKGGETCFAVDGENKYHCIVGGDPCFIVHPSDPAVALIVLNTEVTITSIDGSRQIPLEDFFVLPEENVMRENILQPGEFITEFIIPDLPEGTVSGYLKFKERDVWDFAVVSVAAVVEKAGKQIRSGRVAFGGVAPKPWFEETISNGLTGISASEKNIRELSKSALKEAFPLTENKYKLPLARNLLNRLLTKLILD